MPDLNDLSERELEILNLVAKGKSNKEIAQELFISANTVKVHLRNIFAKIEVSSRTEATLFAVRAGMVEGIAEITPNGGEISNAGMILPRAEEYTPPPAMTVPTSPKWWQRPWRVAGLIMILFFVGVGLNRLFQPQTITSQNGTISSGNNQWITRADLPFPRFGHSATVYENQIIVIGGETNEQIIASTDKYNPETNLWQTLPEKPTAVTDIQAAILGGKIYVPGGRTVSGEATNILEIFDPRENVWSQGAPLPIRVSAYALAAFEGNLYLFGGWDGEKYSSQVIVYDPDLEKWQEINYLPTARAFASGVVVADKIFVMGGYDGKEALDSNLIFFPDRDQENAIPWENAAPLPEGRYAMGVAYITDKIYVLGGIQAHSTSVPQWTFHSDTNEWIVHPEAENENNPNWSHSGIAIVGSNVYAVGGILDGFPTSQNISFQAVYTVPLPVIIKP